MRSLTLFILLLTTSSIFSQSFVTRDIKSFGAKGDGKTNDQAAFEKAAAFFNKRGCNGRLVIPRGTYIVGRQEYTQGKAGLPAYFGHDVLRLVDVKNMTIEGKKGAKLRYKDSLRFGAFNPETGLPHPNKKYFVKYSWAALIGHCIFMENVTNVTVKNIELDGNNKGVILGGVYGDVGRQLPHYGIFIKNSKSITIESVNTHHFALDGISVANKANTTEDDIKLLNSAFEYNARQGLSWIGGNDLKVKGCKFNHTGKGAFGSPPGAGVDIEAEVGPIRGGKFEDCEFINNTGVGMVADNGDSRDCVFKECTFWGVSAWSIWVNRPGFSFKDCQIYGSIVHGYRAEKDEDATRYKDCYFEDKSYNGKPAFGKFLVESNNRKRMSFTGCTFVSNTKKLMWIQTSASLEPEEKYQFNDCKFIINNSNLPKRDYIAVVRGMRYKNCTFQFTNKIAKENRYYLNDCCEKFNVDEGGNKVLYAE